MWLPKIKQGGIIAGHDYLEACFMGVVNAVNETFGADYGYSIKIL